MHPAWEPDRHHEVAALGSPGQGGLGAGLSSASIWLEPGHSGLLCPLSGPRPVVPECGVRVGQPASHGHVGSRKQSVLKTYRGKSEPETEAPGVGVGICSVCKYGSFPGTSASGSSA